MLWPAQEVLGLLSWGHSADACPKEPRSCTRSIIVHDAAALVHKDPWDNSAALEAEMLPEPDLSHQTGLWSLPLVPSVGACDEGSLHPPLAGAEALIPPSGTT